MLPLPCFRSLLSYYIQFTVVKTRRYKRNAKDSIGTIDTCVWCCVNDDKMRREGRSADSASTFVSECVAA